jgi:hypothetical protein
MTGSSNDDCLTTNNSGPIPVVYNLVSAEPTPEVLFLCSAKIKRETGIILKNMFDTGNITAGLIASIYTQHLSYVYSLGAKYFEAGPSSDFTEIIYIFSTGSLEESQNLLRNDPFYKAGYFYDELWFPWEIHSPRWRISHGFRPADENIMVNAGLVPEYPLDIKQSIKEVKIDIITPSKLFACFSKINRGILLPFLSSEPMRSSNIFIQHVYNCSGQGGAGSMGYHWLSGPSVDFNQDLTIFSVNSLFMAQLIKENDAFSRYGVFYDMRYFEWCIHVPFRKASPQHKNLLKRLIEGGK